MKKVLGVCGLVAMTVLPANGGQRLTLAVTPTRSFAPANLRVRVLIDPSVNNRSLAIVADGENFYRSSEIPLEGDRAPKIIDMALPSVPGGDYEIRALLMDASGGQRALAHESVTVLAPFGQ